MSLEPRVKHMSQGLPSQCRVMTLPVDFYDGSALLLKALALPPNKSDQAERLLEVSKVKFYNAWRSIPDNITIMHKLAIVNYHLGNMKLKSSKHVDCSSFLTI